MEALGLTDVTSPLSGWVTWHWRINMGPTGLASPTNGILEITASLTVAASILILHEKLVATFGGYFVYIFTA